MAFHLKLGESVAKGTRRIALEQLDRALHAATDPRARDAAPHAIRKRCKALRGLLRLVRGSFDDYTAEQSALRDAARKLAGPRDAQARLDAVSRLCARDPELYLGPDFAQACSWLESQRSAAGRASRDHDCIEEARAMLQAQRERVAGWTLHERGFDALERGLVCTYRAARRALAAARDEPTAHHLHELRKHVKYHRFHVDLLHRHWPRPLLAVAHEARALGELLGEHHDIDVLVTALRQGDAALTNAARRIEVSVRPQLSRLEHAALCSARRLLAEEPRCFGKRMRRYWNAGTC